MLDMLEKFKTTKEYIYPSYMTTINNQPAIVGDYLTHRRWAGGNGNRANRDAKSEEIEFLKTIGIQILLVIKVDSKQVKKY